MKSFPTLPSRRIVPGFSSNSFSVFGFTLKSLMHLPMPFVDNRPSSKWVYVSTRSSGTHDSSWQLPCVFRGEDKKRGKDI